MIFLTMQSNNGWWRRFRRTVKVSMMNAFEQLLSSSNKNIIIISNPKLKVFVKEIKPGSTSLSIHQLKNRVLAEKLGHYYTTIGNILDQSNASNRMQKLGHITVYRIKYGICTEFDNYIIFFEPYLTVLKWLWVHQWKYWAHNRLWWKTGNHRLLRLYKSDGQSRRLCYDVLHTSISE